MRVLGPLCSPHISQYSPSTTPFKGTLLFGSLDPSGSIRKGEDPCLQVLLRAWTLGLRKNWDASSLLDGKTVSLRASTQKRGPGNTGCARPPALAGDMKERESPGTQGAAMPPPGSVRRKVISGERAPAPQGAAALPRLCQAKIEKKLPKKRRMECRNGRAKNGREPSGLGKRQQVSSLPSAGHAAQDRSAVLSLQCHTQQLQELLHSKPHRQPSAGRNEGAQRSPSLHYRWPPAAPSSLLGSRG